MRPHEIALPLCLLAGLAGPAASQSLPVELTDAFKTLPSPYYGEFVDVDGDVAVVSDLDRDRAYIYERNAGGPDNWGQVKRLTPNGAIRFGQPIAVHGNRVLVGDLARSEVRLYERDEGGPGNWGQVKRFNLFASSEIPGSWFFGYPYAVAIHGDTVAISLGRQRVWIYEKDAGGPDNWGRTAILRGSPLLLDLSGTFGFDMALHEDTLVVAVGGPPTTSAGPGTPLAFVYERREGEWVLTDRLVGTALTFGLGGRISIDVWEDTLVMESLDAVPVYERDAGGRWHQTASLTVPGSSDEYGDEVAVQGDTIFVSDQRGKGIRGTIHCFQRRPDGGWHHVGEVFSRRPQSGGNYFGYGTAVSEDTLIAGQWSGLGGRVYFFDLEPALCTNRTEISLGAGGTARFWLDAGVAHAGGTYLLLGSTTGTSGFTIGGVTIPLDADDYFTDTLFAPNTDPLSSSLGTLDQTGTATASFTLPPGSSLFLAGTLVHHACVVVDATGLAFVSNPVTFDLDA